MNNHIVSSGEWIELYAPSQSHGITVFGSIWVIAELLLVCYACWVLLKRSRVVAISVIAAICGAFVFFCAKNAISGRVETPEALREVEGNIRVIRKESFLAGSKTGLIRVANETFDYGPNSNNWEASECVRVASPNDWFRIRFNQSGEIRRVEKRK